jgi:hypothetical protein
MGRHAESKEAFIVKMNQGDRERLSDFIISLGYFYIRDGVKLPRIGKFLEDVVKGDVVCYRKIFNKPIDNPE